MVFMVIPYFRRKNLRLPFIVVMNTNLVSKSTNIFHSSPKVFSLNVVSALERLTPLKYWTKLTP